MTPTELRALIQDIRDSEPTRELSDRVLLAINYSNMINLVLRNARRPDPLTSVDDATLVVPEDYEWQASKNRGGEYTSLPGIWYGGDVMTYNLEISKGEKSRVNAAHALTLAALEARLAEMEQ